MKNKTTADGRVLTPAVIRGYQQSYREFGIAYRADLSDDGQAFLFGAVHATQPCGCRVTGNGTLQFPLTIEFCKSHQALPVR